MPLTTSNQPAGADGGEISESEIRSRAAALVLASGWKSGEQINGSTVLSLMTKFGRALVAEPPQDRCVYPDCGCEHDSICGDRTAALASTAGAGAGDWVMPAREMIAAAYGVDATAPSEGQMERMHRAADALGRILAGSPAVPASPISTGEDEGRRAIRFALSLEDHWDRVEFLSHFMVGDLDEWPEFASASPPAPAEHGVGIRELRAVAEGLVAFWDRIGNGQHEKLDDLVRQERRALASENGEG